MNDGKETTGPYREESTNLIYNLLFCDDPDLYKPNTDQQLSYPYDILFSNENDITSLEKVAADNEVDPRVRVIAHNKLAQLGHTVAGKELMTVIVEIGLDEGLDVLASFANGTARYINHTGKVLIWENVDDKKGNELTQELFNNSRNIVDQIGPWDDVRRPAPEKGMVRLSFLVADGLYFGEGPIEVLFNDAMAAPALSAATALLQYLTQVATEKE